MSKIPKDQFVLGITGKDKFIEFFNRLDLLSKENEKGVFKKADGNRGANNN